MKISDIKTQRFLAMALCMVVSVLMLALPAVAQDDKGRDRREREDRRARERNRDIEREKWKQTFDLKSYLLRLDGDKNGVLEGKELGNDRTRQFLSTLGINTDNAVKIEAAVKKAEATSANKRDAERKKFEDQVGPKLNSFGTETDTTGLDAFGAKEAEGPTVATFDERLTGLKLTDFDEKTLKDARKILGGYDRDKSGFLEGDEINRIRWQDPKPAESDLNSDGRISLLEMAQRLQNKSAARAERSERDYDRQDRDNDRKDRDYDRRSSRSGRTSASASGRSSVPSRRSSKEKSRSAKSGNDDNAFANYINGVYKKYDTDGDNRLSQAELKKMRRPLKGDIDSDGFLSKEEATNFIKVDNTKNKVDSQVTASSTGNPLSDGGLGMPRKGRGDEAYRKRTTPGGAKSRGKGKSGGGAKSRGSLGDKDTNKDGQIQMSEFSTDWDEATLQKFRKTDTNQDGIISADEWSSRSK